ncbi:MAG TPA: hypothetical protein VKT82_22365 [Ktedonobacterales bacterium]|nr:hypothetical protein [Ktedonobacterales bacterium]
MTRHFWSGFAPLAVALLIALAIIVGMLMIGADVPTALLVGWLVSGLVCLGIGAWRHDSSWATPGFIQLGGALAAALIWQGIVTWWWPLGLVALGVAYMALANLRAGQAVAGWRSALESSAFFVAGVGAVWELGQVGTAFLLASQGTPLLADDANAVRASFLLSSLLLLGGALLWALMLRRLPALALAAPLLAQLAVALVITTTEIGNPSAQGLFALSLLVVALACHVGTYLLRFWLPDLAPALAPRPWRVFLQRGGRAKAAQALKVSGHPDAWGLCLLLDGFALLFAIGAILPVAAQPTAHAPNSGPLLIALSAGVGLCAAVAYWQQAPWLLLLGGCFLAGDIYTLGLYAAIPASAWPLLYFAATTGFLGLAIWLRSVSGQSWARSSLFLALGLGAVTLVFALQRQSLAWGLGMALALAAAAALAFWGWRIAQDASQS